MASYRRSLRTHSWIALVAFLCGWMLPFAEQHPLGQDDPCVVSGPAGAESSSAKIARAPADQNEPTHCLICHLTRAMNGMVQAGQGLQPVPFAGVARSPLHADAALTVSYSATPPRGPPVTI